MTLANPIFEINDEYDVRLINVDDTNVTEGMRLKVVRQWLKEALIEKINALEWKKVI